MDEELEAALMRAGQQIEQLQRQCEVLRAERETAATTFDEWFASDVDPVWGIPNVDLPEEKAKAYARRVWAAAAAAGDGWPKLTKPARVGNGTFGAGAEARHSAPGPDAHA